MPFYDASNLSVLVTSAGRQLDYSKYACDSLEFSTRAPGGDESASVTIQYQPGSGLPRRFSRFEIFDTYDSSVPVWSGMITGVSVQNWDGCSSSEVQISAVGWAALLGYRVFQQRTVFGRTWADPYDPTQPLTYNPGVQQDFYLNATDAIQYAVALGGQGIIFPGTGSDHYGPLMETVGNFTEATEDFFLRTPQDVINSVTALFSYLSTPLVWEVWCHPNGAGSPLLTWRPRPFSIEYSIELGKAVMNLTDNASDVYNEAVAGYGKDLPGIVVPDSSVGAILHYELLSNGIIHDKSINLQGEFDTVGPVYAAVQGLYNKFSGDPSQNVVPGWSYEINIPTACVVDQHSRGTIPPWRIRANNVIGITNLNAGENFGNDVYHGGPPDSHYITGTHWSSKSNTQSVSCGEWHDEMTLMRKLIVTRSPLKDTFSSAGTQAQKKETATAFGPSTPNPATGPGPGASSRLSYGEPAYDKKTQEVAPDVLPKQPMSAELHWVNGTGDPIEIGAVVPALMPIGQLEAWQIIADKRCTVTVQLYQGKPTTDGDGNIQPPAIAPFQTITMTNDIEHYETFPPAPKINIYPSNITETSIPSAWTQTIVAKVTANDNAVNLQVNLQGIRLFRDSVSTRVGV